MVEIVVFFYIVLPLLLLALLLVRCQAKISAVSLGLAVLSFYLLRLLIGNTTWLGPTPPRVFMLLAGLGFILSCIRHRHSPWFNRFALPTVVVTLLSTAFLVLQGINIRSYLKTRQFDGPFIDLSFPLRHGTYTVGQGGSQEITNHHVGVRAQSYAIDIVKTDADGRRARGLLPPDLPSYFTYGEDIYAPCSGEILAFSTIIADQTPPQSSPFSLAGNYVILFCKNSSILLAHLQAGSVRVKTGDSVQESTLLARVGNSGNTSEPHLHIHAIQGRETDIENLLRDGNPLPVRWNGRFLIRGDSLTVD